MKHPIYNSSLRADPSKRLRPKAKKRLATKSEKTHLESVKSLDCAFCAEKPPSEAHHIRRGTEYKNHHATIPLCADCHDAVGNNRSAYRKHEEMALIATLRELYGEDELPRYLRLAGRDTEDS